MLTPAFAAGQNYRPIVSTGAAWQFVHFEWPSQFVTYWNYYYLKTPEINADTLIQSQTYHKLYKNTIAYNFAEYKGCYRSDSTGKSWWLPRNDSVEYLLMDLNVNPGDTVNNVYVETNLTPPYLLSVHIDSIGWHISGNKVLRKVYGTTAPFSLHRVLWIEELGSMLGFFNLGVGSLPYDYYQPICVSVNDTSWYYQADTVVYLNSAMNLPDTMVPVVGGCSLFVNTVVGMDGESPSNYCYYPNPATTNFIVEPNSNTPSTLRIYTLAGQFLHTQRIQGRTEIEVSTFPEGVYLLELETPQAITRQKLLLQR
jgi:hypothetical protein